MVSAPIRWAPQSVQEIHWNSTMCCQDLAFEKAVSIGMRLESHWNHTDRHTLVTCSLETIIYFILDSFILKLSELVGITEISVYV